MVKHWMLLVALASSGCVAQGAYEEVARERDQLEAQASDLKSRVSALEAERNKLIRQLGAAEGKAKSADSAVLKDKVIKFRTELGLTDGQKISAAIKTTVGTMNCELWPNIAPKTVANFVGLSEGTKEWTDPNTREKRTDPLYNGTIFHRIIPNFMIQGGDPMGSGRGGPGYRFEDEVSRDVQFDAPGLLAMANSGPGTNGSQFFITDSTPRHLNGKHTIFGKCANLDIMKAIINAPVTDRRSNKPIDAVSIQSITITRK